MRLPYNLNSVAQVLGPLAVTELLPEIRAIVATVVAERDRVSRVLAGFAGRHGHAEPGWFLMVSQ